MIIRRGKVTVKANKTDPCCQTFSVVQDGDWIGYYHGGPTCNTKDGYVTLPEEWLDRVRWDEPAEPNVHVPEDES